MLVGRAQWEAKQATLLYGEVGDNKKTGMGGGQVFFLLAEQRGDGA